MKTIEVKINNDVMTVALNRPDVHNAFNSEMIQELTTTFKSLLPTVRAVVLRGHGKSFCAGADLNWMKSMSKYSYEENIKDSTQLFDMFEAIRSCPVPVIGRIQGSVFGGGVGLVAVCDIVAAVRETKFCFSEAKLGLVPAVISPFVLKKIPYAFAKHMMITAQIFSEEKAFERGLINFIGADEEVDDFVQSQVDFILSNGPEAVRATKQLVDFVSDHVWADVKAPTVKTIAERRVSPEGQEGMQAFFNKTKPSWKTT